MGEAGCTDCHRFGETGESLAPDLTGYGSREWLLGMISNPGHERFYGEKNERMPAFGGSGESPGSLSETELRLLVDWLRGDWYEPSPEVAE